MAINLHSNYLTTIYDEEKAKLKALLTGKDISIIVDETIDVKSRAVVTFGE